MLKKFKIFQNRRKNKMAICAGYIRVSSSQQRDKGSSLEDQKDLISKKAEFDKNEIFKIYEDGGVSGGSTDRPALQELLKDAKQKKFSILYFTKLDRIGRSNRDIANIYHELNEVLKIDLISVSDPSLNSTGAMGKVLLGILSVFAEFERTLIRDRMHSGIMNKWKSGDAIIGALPYGYQRIKNEKGEYIAHPEQKKIYEKIVSLYLDERLSSKQIALELTKTGTETPSSSKKSEELKKKRKIVVRWDSSVIIAMLKNEAYKGSIQYNMTDREWVTGLKGTRYMKPTGKAKEDSEPITIRFEPLITKKRFEQVQLRIGKQRKINRHQNKDYPFLLGPYVYCKICGSRMMPVTWVNKKNGKVYRWYKCNSNQGGALYRELRGIEKCAMKPQSAEVVEGRVFTKVMDVLTNINEYAASWIKDINAEEVQNDIKSLNERIKSAEKAWEAGFDYIRTVSDSDLKEKALSKQKLLENELNGFKIILDQKSEQFRISVNKAASLHKLDKLFKGRNMLKGKTKLKGFLLNLDFQQKRALVDSMISSEIGGRISISYITADDFLSPDEMKGMSPEELHKPLMDRDREPNIEIDFRIEPDRIGNLIQGLDKHELRKMSS
jgi:DNA invertase Pin-like site-specific DNA recombinase